MGRRRRRIRKAKHFGSCIAGKTCDFLNRPWLVNPEHIICHVRMYLCTCVPYYPPSMCAYTVIQYVLMLQYIKLAYMHMSSVYTLSATANMATVPGLLLVYFTAKAYFIKKPLPTVTVYLGENRSIECVGGGKPQPRTVWRKLGQSGGELKDSSKGLLNLSNIKESDGGVYECVVIGDRNTVTANTTVIVSTKERKCSWCMHTHAHARTHTHSSSYKHTHTHTHRDTKHAYTCTHHACTQHRHAQLALVPPHTLYTLLLCCFSLPWSTFSSTKCTN